MEIIDALRRAPPPTTDDPGLSFHELRAQIGQGESALRARLRALVEKGTVAVGFQKRMNILGTTKIVPVYRLVVTEEDTCDTRPADKLTIDDR